MQQHNKNNIVPISLTQVQNVEAVRPMSKKNPRSFKMKAYTKYLLLKRHRVLSGSIADNGNFIFIH